MSYAIDVSSKKSVEQYVSVDAQSGEVRATKSVDREKLCANGLRGPSCELNFIAALTSAGGSERFVKVRYENNTNCTVITAVIPGRCY